MDSNSNQTDLISPQQNQGENGHKIDLSNLLLEKREILIQQLEQINIAILQIQEELSSKLTQLQARKKPAEEALQHIEALLKLEGWSTNNTPNISANTDPHITNGALSATDAAYNLLEELHQPMHYKEMANKLQERYIYVPGKDPAATLLSKMTRDKRFKRTRKRGIYALSSWLVRTPKSKSRKLANKKKR